MKKKINLIFFLLIIVVIAIIAILIMKLSPKKEEVEVRHYKVKESITVESGSRLPELKDYFEEDAPKKGTIKYYEKSMDITDKKDYYYYTKKDKDYVMGTATLEVKITDASNITYTSKLIIEDTEEPKVKTKNLTVQSYTKYEAKDFIDEYTDNSYLDDYTATFTEDTYKEVGNYEIKLKICDLSDNCIEKETKLKIIPGETKIGSYKLSYGKYKGQICNETDIKYCRDSHIYVLGEQIKLNDGTLKSYITDGNRIILSNGEVFTIIGDNKLEYQNALKSIYEFEEEA